ncbi:MAG: tRNA uridine-5-carboxymethylaminomethyl(34) synthesis enzyme MnmG [Spirochaetales bacterium]|nr:tRNA uridine-5-carboxymethylaminomethyl(34) synthesis enzyme MnmG [Spirochaetales bacterium]
MDFDAIVIGGGHAGIEAAMALSRLQFRTLFITQSLDAIGRLSCNPAVGGLAKGNLVREIDALGGEMAHLIDKTMIQFRMLNKSKGPAVQAPRAQADKQQYSLLAKHTLESQKHLHLFQDTVTELLTNTTGTAATGVKTERGKKFCAKVVVVTTGTFMEGTIFIGPYSASSGRLGEPAAVGLGTHLRNLGFDVGRLKTGTPARVLRQSIDFNQTEEQAGDIVQLPFSFDYDAIDRPKVSCWITYTTANTHRIIRENISSSPLYSGKITGVGPRYCPSIEDKVMRFPDRERHQIFIEPEGLSTEEMYLNGISSSLPEEVQEQFLRSVPGLENIIITRPGYAVEYDYLNPVQLYPSLESKRLQNLFFAGQTNGTSGYEEAAAQGLMAGINASRKLMKKEPLVLSRTEAYIGVLIDDLVTLGTTEPYRLFTSRAEHRLSLRHDTAEMRLFEKAQDIGLKSKEAITRFQEKKQKIEEITELLQKRKVTRQDSERSQILEKHIGKQLAIVLRDPEITMETIAEIENSIAAVHPTLQKQIELDIKYEGYIKKQDEETQRVQRLERLSIPQEFDYDGIDGMSAESREKLKKILPVSVGQAARISGVRNSDISLIILYLTKKNKKT